MHKSSQTLKNSEIAVQTEQGSAILFDLRALTHFRDDGPNIQVLSDTGAARLVLFAFQAGQRLKEHSTSSQFLVHVLRGRITFNTPGHSAKLRAGMIVQVEASIPHSVTATTDAVMLLIMTPGPTYHSLQQEIFDKLTPLVSRALPTT